ncbi:hypothetical protein GDO86_005195 [Hymenochirus boettgeri]|uniref:Uncharacterized protein n=1 Tax=Hymenochirus boettgeri TaxID=247094 RepID=A0A8T2J8F9_9PIPI|nr:hypothetical protein GDO86_005195 [Hymenochirus boettgeri]
MISYRPSLMSVTEWFMLRCFVMSSYRLSTGWISQIHGQKPNLNLIFRIIIQQNTSNDGLFQTWSLSKTRSSEWQFYGLGVFNLLYKGGCLDVLRCLDNL